MMVQVIVNSAVSNASKVLVQKIADIAPDWAWGHFAKARIAEDNKDPDTTILELRKCIELDGTPRRPYLRLFPHYRSRKDYDAAIELAEKMAGYPGNFVETGQTALWTNRFLKSANSPEDRAKLKAEAAKLAESTTDIDTLVGVARIYSSLFKDEGAKAAVIEKIHKIDPLWYPERGDTNLFFISLSSGVDRVLNLANHDLAIFNRINGLGKDLLPDEKMKEIESILAAKPSRRATEVIYRVLFFTAAEAKDSTVESRYGEALHLIEPYDDSILPEMALALANDKIDLDKAKYARAADSATTEFHPFALLPDIDPDLFREGMTDAKQHEAYNENRALTLHALGWTLCQTGNYAEGEAKLRQSVQLKRNKDNLQHLAFALRKLGRMEDSEKVTLEAENLLTIEIKDEINNSSQRAADFSLQTIDGRKVKLSDLKGKVVMIDFWATWCGPCVKEMPDLKKLYAKYKDKGFEILAISVDVPDDLQKVKDFVKSRQLDFTVLIDEKTRGAFSVSAYPTSIFVDRDGKMRYRMVGTDDDSIKSIEIALGELLK